MTNQPQQGASELTRDEAAEYLDFAKRDGLVVSTVRSKFLIALCDHYLRTTAPAVAELESWERKSMEILAAALEKRGDSLSADSATWLRKYLAAPPERTAQPTGASEADHSMRCKIIEADFERDTMTIEMIGEYKARAGEHILTPSTAQPNWREPLEALLKNMSMSIPRVSGKVESILVLEWTDELRALIDKLAAQQKGE